MSPHILSVLVENKPGVLSRVAGLFSRRNFNIHSLAVGPTERPDVSRMTIVVAADLPVVQVVRQVDKLVNVLAIEELPAAASVLRELLLVTVRAPVDCRREVLLVARSFRAAVVDVNDDTVTLEATGRPEELEELLARLTPYGVVEMAQSGAIALAPGEPVHRIPLHAVPRPA